MLDREKLIEWIRDAVNGCSSYWVGLIADNLIDNGVTLQEKVHDCHWATEQAYKNGYEAGKRDATDGNVGCKWIPVTERLPQEGERVLFTDGTWVGEGYINKRGKWQRYLNQSYMDVIALDVTHWMELPESPKENEK